MEGTVKQVIFIVPHSIIYLDVKGFEGRDGHVVARGNNPGQRLFLKGVKKEDVQVGRSR